MQSRSPAPLHTQLSSPAKAGDPVRRGSSVQSPLSLEYWIPACAGMTTENDCAISRHVCPRFKRSLALLEFRGRREDRVRAAPAVSCAICALKTRTRAYRFSGNTPAFPAQWLYGLLRALPGERLFCHRYRVDTSTQLDASTAASGPHDFAVRIMRVRLCAFRVHRIPPHVRDDHDPPLDWVRRAELCR